MYINNMSLKNIREQRLKKNVILSISIKILIALISLIQVRVTLDFLETESIYGLWLTILQVLTWISMFDIGTGNGLRNKLTGAIALNDYDKGKKYVSTTYFVMFCFAGASMVLFFAIQPIINWNYIFHTNSSEIINISLVMRIMVPMVMLQLFFSIINSVLLAFHDAYMPAFIQLLTNLFILLLIVLFKYIGIKGLVTVGCIYVFVPIGVLLLSSYLFFNGKYKYISPSVKYIQKSLVSDLFMLGIKFFIMQIAVLIIFSTSSLIINNTLGSAKVTTYQIVYRLFSILTFISGIVLGPLWSEYTSAYTRGDFIWIKNVLKKQILLMIPYIISTIFLILSARFFIRIWIGRDIGASNLFISIMGLFVIQSTWNNIFSFVLNGIGKINLSLLGCIFMSILSPILTINLAHLLDIEGVILATIISLLLGSILGPIQVYYLIYSKKKSKLLDKLFS